MIFSEQDVFGAGETVISSWSAGAGSAGILILNDFGAPAVCWQDFAKNLAPEFRIVGFHYRGTYGSSRPLNESQTGVDDHVADAMAVLDHHRMSSPIIVGWSTGAPIAFRLAASYPDRIRALLAVAGVPRASDSAGRLVELLSGTLISGAAKVARLLPNPLLSLINKAPVDSATANFLQRSGLLSADIETELLTEVIAGYLAQDPNWYLRLVAGEARSKSSDSGPLSCPVRMLAGRSDILIPAPLALQAAQRIPGATLDMLPGSHFLPLEQPVVVADALREMVGRTGTSPAH